MKEHDSEWCDWVTPLKGRHPLFLDLSVIIFEEIKGLKGKRELWQKGNTLNVKLAGPYLKIC